MISDMNEVYDINEINKFNKINDMNDDYEHEWRLNAWMMIFSDIEDDS